MYSTQAVGRWRYRAPAFWGSALLINLICSALARTIDDPSRRPLVAFGAAFDLTVTVSVIYYFLLVRPGLRGRVSMLFIAGFGMFRAALAFPGVIPGRMWMAAGMEIAVLAGAAATVRKFRHSRDTAAEPVERIAAALQSMLPARLIAEAMATELAIVYYAFLSWRARPHIPAGARAFTVGEKSGAADLLYVVAIGSSLEIIPVHLLVAHWNATAAWIATAVSAYGAVWALGIARSIRLLPVLIAGETVHFRFGLLLRAQTPVANVASIRGAEKTAIGFAEPVEIRRMPGIARRAGSLNIALDDPGAFERALSLG